MRKAGRAEAITIYKQKYSIYFRQGYVKKTMRRIVDILPRKLPPLLLKSWQTFVRNTQKKRGRFRDYLQNDKHDDF